MLFLLPMVMPLSLSLLLTGDMVQISMGLILAIFVSVMSMFAQEHTRSIRGALSLVIENQRLIDDLSSANNQLKQEVDQKQTTMEQLIEEKERIQVTL